MRNAKLWNDGIKDYLALFPNCSPIEMKYSNLGKTKMFQWVKELRLTLSLSLYLTFKLRVWGLFYSFLTVLRHLLLSQS